MTLHPSSIGIPASLSCWASYLIPYLFITFASHMTWYSSNEYTNRCATNIPRTNSRVHVLIAPISAWNTMLHFLRLRYLSHRALFRFQFSISTQVFFLKRFPICWSLVILSWVALSTNPLDRRSKRVAHPIRFPSRSLLKAILCFGRTPLVFKMSQPWMWSSWVQKFALPVYYPGSLLRSCSQ